MGQRDDKRQKSLKSSSKLDDLKRRPPASAWPAEPTHTKRFIFLYVSYMILLYRNTIIVLHPKKNVPMVAAIVLIRDARVAVIFPSHVYAVFYTSDEVTMLSLEEILKYSAA